MITAPLHEHELSRLLDLTELDLDYTELSEHLDGLTDLAARLTDTSISMVNFIDAYSQWTVSDHGIEIQKLPREQSICQYTILENEMLEVENMAEDHRFQDLFYVKGEPHIRYYLGIPLRFEDGLPIGSLCVMDPAEKELGDKDVETLKILADEVVEKIRGLVNAQRLQKRVKELTNLNRKLSHDIRGPISGIIGVAEMVEMQGESNTLEELMEYMNLVKEGGESVLELADEIMKQRSYTAENVQEGDHLIDLDELASKLRHLYSSNAIAKKLDFRVSAEENASGLRIPKYGLLQICGNLISNAMKFTPDGGKVSVHLNAISNKKGEPKELLIEVRDSGKGMPQEKVREIMEGDPHSTPGTEGEKGYGYGLSVVKHIIDKREGSLEIVSETGKGTTFHIHLPM